MPSPPPMTTLELLGARLLEQTLDVAALRLALDIQSHRIARTQVEVEVSPPSAVGRRPARS